MRQDALWKQGGRPDVSTRKAVCWLADVNIWDHFLLQTGEPEHRGSQDSQTTGLGEGDHLPPGHKHLDNVTVIACQAKQASLERGGWKLRPVTQLLTQIEELFQENLKG